MNGEAIWKKLERTNKNARETVRRSQTANNRAEGMAGTLGAYRKYESNMKPTRNRNGGFYREVLNNYVKDLVTFCMAFGVGDRNKLSRSIVIKHCSLLSKYSGFTYEDLSDLFDQSEGLGYGFWIVEKIDEENIVLW